MPSNYSTRPNKHVDRELFVELVGRALSTTPTVNCGYFSMGGPQMVDQISMYRKNGITKLYSFDGDEEIVKRQEFNAPTAETVCRQHLAEELAPNIDDLKEEMHIGRSVVWFDYTGNSERAVQIWEFATLLEKLEPGDIARISLDASFPPAKRLAELTEELRNDRLAGMNELVRQEFGDLHPEDVELSSQFEMPKYLSKCVEQACARAQANIIGVQVEIAPLLLTTYCDSSPMFTAAVMLCSDDVDTPMPAGFDFLCSNWLDIENLEVPDLTAREKSLMDRLLDRSIEEVDDALDYDIARKNQRLRQWEAFKKFHRFLPQFQHVELR